MREGGSSNKLLSNLNECRGRCNYIGKCAAAMRTFANLLRTLVVTATTANEERKCTTQTVNLRNEHRHTLISY